MEELKLTTAAALAYEEKTGKDILETLAEIAAAASQGKMPKLKQIIDIYCAMGDDHTVEKFDEWDVSLTDKIEAISEAARVYIVGKNAKRVSANSSKGATRSGSNQKKSSN